MSGCETCNDTGELVECANDGTHGCSHRWDRSYPCPDCRGTENGYDSDPLCQCQGCGEYRGIAALGSSHACHRAEDGTYEEGGTFQ